MKGNFGTKVCDLCATPLTDHSHYFDGATRMGPWAVMCPPCHRLEGRGIGVGRGQKYDSVTNEQLEGGRLTSRYRHLIDPDDRDGYNDDGPM